MKKLVLFAAITLFASQLQLQASDLLKEIKGGSDGLMPIVNSSNFYMHKADGTVEIYDADFNIIDTYNKLGKYERIVGASYQYFSMGLEYELIIEKKLAGKLTYGLRFGDTEFIGINFGEYKPLIYGKKFVAVKTTEKGGKLIYDHRVYAIGGRLNSTKPVFVKKNGKAYPVPARDLVSIEYDTDNVVEMQITNSHGGLVERIILPSGRGSYRLDISGYSHGSYLYSYGNTSGKFIVK